MRWIAIVLLALVLLPSRAAGQQVVTIDSQGLGPVAIAAAPAEPYDACCPPGPTGIPAHTAVSIGGEVRLRIIPAAEYAALWNANGDDRISRLVNSLTSILASRPVSPTPPLPILPPAAATNDLAIRVRYLDVTGGSGVRFVGRLAQDPSPIEPDQLRYWFMGLSTDGQSILSFEYPVVPNFASVPADVAAPTLETLPDSAYTPSLDRLDAVIRSITIGTPAGGPPASVPPPTPIAPTPPLSPTMPLMPAAPGLTDRTWAWQSVQFGNDTSLQVPNPARYTIRFSGDGRVALRADCNVGNGGYTLTGSRIRLTPIALTRAACPPESLDTAFLALLQQAETYRLDGDRLGLSLPYDTGTMLFAELPGS